MVYIVDRKFLTSLLGENSNKRLQRVDDATDNTSSGPSCINCKTEKQHFQNKSCRRTASSPAGYILYCNIFIIKPYNIGHTDLDVFVCKSFCHIDIIIQV